MRPPGQEVKATVITRGWKLNPEGGRIVLEKAGLDVASLIGTDDVLVICKRIPPRLLILGQSVPRKQKRRLIKSCRRCCSAPALSLLDRHQSKLPEADYGAEIDHASELIAAVRTILENR
jgi:hypothetical protein